MRAFFAPAARRPGPRVPRRRFVDRGRRLVAATLAVGLLGTLFISIVPSLSFAYRSDATHAAIETSVFLVAAVAALLFAGRTLRARSRTDLLLAGSLAVLAATNLCFSLLPAMTDSDPGNFATWAPVAGRLLGAVGFAAAALLPDRELARPRRDLGWMLLATGMTLGLIALLGALFADQLPRGLDPELSPETAERPRIVGNPVVLSAQVSALFLYAAATVGFLRRAERERDGLLLWVALAAALSALARLNYFLFPSLYSEWVYVGDALRLGGYLALLVGIARELLAYQRQAAELAVFDERRRLARELHDGLAQELAYIRSEGTRLTPAMGSDSALLRIVAAAERALEEARVAISSLTRPLDESLETSLRRAAEAVALRLGAEVEATSVGDAEISDSVRQALERIVREATANAVRHGEATLVRVELDCGAPLRVTIADNGSGFDPDGERRPDGFGLISMRERAEALGATFAIRSAPGHGTTVEVLIP